MQQVLIAHHTELLLWMDIFQQDFFSSLPEKGTGKSDYWPCQDQPAGLSISPDWKVCDLTLIIKLSGVHEQIKQRGVCGKAISHGLFTDCVR